MNIYLAGKISKHGWREQIFAGCGIDTHGEFDKAAPRDAAWPRIPFTHDVHQYTYVGPYFTACDHGCAHDVSHAFVRKFKCDHENNMSRRRAVARLRVRAIRDSHVVFAWINNIDIFGTLWELGFAAALGKIVIVSGEPYAEHWFARVNADLELRDEPNPLTAFDKAMRRVRGEKDGD